MYRVLIMISTGTMRVVRKEGPLWNRRPFHFKLLNYKKLILKYVKTTRTTQNKQCMKDPVMHIDLS